MKRRVIHLKKNIEEELKERKRGKPLEENRFKRKRRIFWEGRVAGDP